MLQDFAVHGPQHDAILSLYTLFVTDRHLCEFR